MRTIALACVTGTMLLAHANASAQDAGDDYEEPAVEDEFIVVTGSRIAQDGYNAPTPLTVIGDDAIATTANDSIRQTLVTLPVFQGGISTTSGAGVPSFNQAGLSTLELRNLGGNRTLILFDGQRTVPSTSVGVVDIDNFPEQLIERVEVVTGGASAVYGSDAVAGVVNFVLDRDFTGIKGELSGGVTSYGDAENYKIAISAGTPFADGRGHFLISGAMVENDGVVNGNGSREWARTTLNYIVNPAYTPTNGEPEFLLRDDVFLATATHGGIITSGPLKGIAFGEGGVPYQFNYGEGVERDHFMSGGDYLATRTDDAFSLLPSAKRHNIFGRLSFDVTDSLTLFAQASRGVSQTYGIAFPHYQARFGPVVKSGNPFIPDSVQQRMDDLGLDSFQIGSMNYDQDFVAVDTKRAANRFVLGIEGDFMAFGSGWDWNAYAQIGKTTSNHDTLNVENKAHYALALDAVRDPTTGAIVCRSTLTDPGNGCVPWNPLGTGVNDQLAKDYLMGTAEAVQSTKQTVYAASITGEPFSSWAGPVGIALSAEYRKEEANVNADPIALSSGWRSGNHQFLDADTSVKEAAIEANIPLLRDNPFAYDWDLSLAYRATDYEVSGFVSTWKIGTSYSPVPDLRIRATLSRDIRAPNLSELFQEQDFGLITTYDPVTNTTPTHGRTQTGNPDLQPEKAKNLTVGAVFQPEFIPGLNMSVDYWRVKIDDAIQLINGSQVIELCYQGRTDLCPRITRNSAGAITTVEQGNFNFASQKASGLDVEASYTIPMLALFGDSSSSLNLRILATHYFENVIEDDNSPSSDSVGTLGGSPETSITASASYEVGALTSTLTARYFSDLVSDNDYIECTSGCPTSSTYQRTFDQLGVDGATYLDLSLQYDISGWMGGDESELFVNIRNLLNEDPELVPSIGTSGLGYIYSRTNTGRYDTLGRVYRVGVRVQF